MYLFSIGVGAEQRVALYQSWPQEPNIYISLVKETLSLVETDAGMKYKYPEVPAHTFLTLLTLPVTPTCQAFLTGKALTLPDSDKASP